MCGRYALYETNQLVRRFGTKRPDFELHDSYNVAPGQFMPVITGGTRGPVLKMMKWGLVPKWAPDMSIGYKLINARAENVFERPMWRSPVRHHRCLVPAHGFYEWRGGDSSGRKQPYFIHPRSSGLFAFAGLYDIWTDQFGNELWSYAIITTEPNEEMSLIHDRMPVMLLAEEESMWLDESVQERLAIEFMLHPYPDGELEIYEVSSDVNVVRNNDNHLIYPMNSR